MILDWMRNTTKKEIEEKNEENIKYFTNYEPDPEVNLGIKKSFLKKLK